MASKDDQNRSRRPKGRYVPSRYKLAAEGYSSHSSGGNSLLPDKVINSTVLDKTNANRTTSKKTHSTPVFHGAAPPHLDQSAIPSIGVQKVAGSLGPKTKIVKSSAQKSSSIVCSDSSGSHKSKTKLNQSQEDLESELDTVYAQYQLNLLLENKARKSLHDKSSVALEKIYEVFAYIQMLLGKQESIKKSLNVVSFLLELHDHLHRQEKMLEPALEVIDSLEEQYAEIATAVDCVRHKLIIEDIESPEGFEEEIIHLVNNISDYLDAILTSVADVDGIEASADSLSAFVRRGKLASDGIKRCQGLLTESRSLLLSEASLKFSSSLCNEDSIS